MLTQLGPEPVLPPVVEPVLPPVVEPVLPLVVEPVLPPVVEPVLPPVEEPVLPPVVDHSDRGATCARCQAGGSDRVNTGHLGRSIQAVRIDGAAVSVPLHPVHGAVAARRQLHGLTKAQSRAGRSHDYVGVPSASSFKCIGLRLSGWRRDGAVRGSTTKRGEK